MDWDEIQKNWTRVSDKIKLRWGKLSEADLIEIAGRRHLLVAMLEKKYRYDKSQVERVVDDFANRLELVDATK